MGRRLDPPPDPEWGEGLITSVPFPLRRFCEQSNGAAGRIATSRGQVRRDTNATQFDYLAHRSLRASE
jgi:hypothetical protein